MHIYIRETAENQREELKIIQREKMNRLQRNGKLSADISTVETKQLGVLQC